ncbi:hypothetical protein LTR37_008959 [Vermiconidia calcicola]|uniref:Uncharacterized protein n=1 Tax=Vermiconidia calcicola TaxID=1690605 RepID=A0ACC3NAC9_9PEZI|nr:hypothetical protein LTR37_008959 [Vermiconidia calcicola]
MFTNEIVPITLCLFMYRRANLNSIIGTFSPTTSSAVFITPEPFISIESNFKVRNSSMQSTAASLLVADKVSREEQNINTIQITYSSADGIGIGGAHPWREAS